MGLLPPVKLSDEEKLATLQRLDQFREWHSLDDRRYCLSCGALITGQQIQMVGGSRGTGPLRAICPTRNCRSIPMDWALPTDEVLAKMSTCPCAGNENSVAARLRNLARHFRRFSASFSRT
jgi:hypothetical protein